MRQEDRREKERGGGTTKGRRVRYGVSVRMGDVIPAGGTLLHLNEDQKGCFVSKRNYVFQLDVILVHLHESLCFKIKST